MDGWMDGDTRRRLDGRTGLCVVVGGLAGGNRKGVWGQHSDPHDHILLAFFHFHFLIITTTIIIMVTDYTTTDIIDDFGDDAPDFLVDRSKLEQSQQSTPKVYRLEDYGNSVAENVTNRLIQDVNGNPIGEVDLDNNGKPTIRDRRALEETSIHVVFKIAYYAFPLSPPRLHVQLLDPHSKATVLVLSTNIFDAPSPGEKRFFAKPGEDDAIEELERLGALRVCKDVAPVKMEDTNVECKVVELLVPFDQVLKDEAFSLDEEERKAGANLIATEMSKLGKPEM